MRRSTPLAFVLLLAACVPAPAPVPPAAVVDGPPPDPGRYAGLPADFVEMLPGVEWAAVEADGHLVWLYRPTGAGEDRSPRPLVVVPPAGSNLVTGMGLADGDRPEHLPYVEAGFCVAAFAISGAEPARLDDEAAYQRSMQAFAASELGIADARRAISVAMAHLPVDEKRIVVAGHSSAGTLALQVAAVDDRVDEVIAFAPVTDLVANFGDNFAVIEREIPDLTAKLRAYSPLALVPRLDKPVFLFHARDDQVVLPQETEALAAKLGYWAERVEVDSGGHYDSMIVEGLPKAIDWIDSAGSREEANR